MRLHPARAVGLLRAPWIPGWAKDPLWRQARSVPSLDLRFADNKSLVDATTGQNLIDFSRASIGTYVDSEGVIRNATTNLLLQSQALTTSPWGDSAATTTLAPTVPDIFGGTDATFKLTEDNTNAAHYLSQAFTAAASTYYAVTAWFKQGSANRDGRILLTNVNAWDGLNAPRCRIEFSTGTVQQVLGFTSTNLTPYADGWYKFTGVALSSASGGIFSFRLMVSDGAEGYQGDGVSFVYLGPAQLEESSTVGEYIPTTSSINSAPRFDHDPETGESLGLLVEEERTNLLLRSEEFDQSPWTSNVSPAITTNAIESPSGSVTADLIAASATSSGYFQSVTVTSGVSYTLSYYVKAAPSATDPVVRLGFGGNLVFFDTSLGSTTSVSGIWSSTSAQAVGNGWYRVSMTGTAATTSYAVVSYGNSSGSQWYLWGAQLEEGSFPTSYIKNVDTPGGVTRAADVASIEGTNFSSWYNQSEGTVFCGFSRSALIGSSNFANLWALSDNTASERFLTYNTGALQTMDTAVTDGGVAQGTLQTPGAITANSTQNHAFVYKVDDFAAVRNAGSVITDTSGSLPAVDRIYIGANHSGGGQFSGAIRRLAYWGQRLSSNVLQSITR